MKTYRVTWREGYQDEPNAQKYRNATAFRGTHAEAVKVAAVKYAESCKHDVEDPFVVVERGEVAVSKETVLSLLDGDRDSVFTPDAVVFDIDAPKAEKPKPKKAQRKADDGISGRNPAEFN